MNGLIMIFLTPEAIHILIFETRGGKSSGNQFWANRFYSSLFLCNPKSEIRSVYICNQVRM